MTGVTKPYNPLSGWLKERFGEKVFKVSLDSGFTCPNRDGSKGTGGCIYCEPATLIPEANKGRALSIEEQLSTGIERVRARHRADRFIAYYQINTNTYAPVGRLRELYAPALARPEVVSIAVSTRPDCLGEDVLDLLSEIKGKKHLWVEIGLQSANDSTLGRIGRGHTVKDFEDAVRRASSRGIDVCAHVIIGLPGEGRAEALGTAGFLARFKVWGVKFHQLQVVRGTPLEGLYSKGEIRPPSLEEYSSIVVEFLERLPRDTVVHRLSGDTPGNHLVAPRWGANKFEVIERILSMMGEMGTFQGRLHKE